MEKGKAYGRKVVLASGSAPRLYLLRIAGFDPVVVGQTFDEDELKKSWGGSAAELAMKIALGKINAAVLDGFIEEFDEEYFLISADTVAEIGEKERRIVGKPKDREEAKEFLREMREKGVHIVTGLAVRLMRGREIFGEKVEFVRSFARYEVPENELDFYIDNEPLALDVTAAGVVEGLGSRYLRSIEGSYSNIVGLPLFEAYRAMGELAKLREEQLRSQSDG